MFGQRSQTGDEKKWGLVAGVQELVALLLDLAHKVSLLRIELLQLLGYTAKLILRLGELLGEVLFPALQLLLLLNKVVVLLSRLDLVESILHIQQVLFLLLHLLKLLLDLLLKIGGDDGGSGALRASSGSSGRLSLLLLLLLLLLAGSTVGGRSSGGRSGGGSGRSSGRGANLGCPVSRGLQSCKENGSSMVRGAGVGNMVHEKPMVECGSQSELFHE